MKMDQKFEVEIAGLRRMLPLQRIDENLVMPVFVAFNDVALTQAAATQLLEQVPEFDVILTEEVQGVPLAYEMSRQADKARYVVARKQAKAYMANVAAIQLEVEDEGEVFYPRRYLSQEDADFLKGKRVLVVDDMVMAGRTMRVLEDLANALGGYVVGKATILAYEGLNCEDLVTLAELPPYKDKDTNE